MPSPAKARVNVRRRQKSPSRNFMRTSGNNITSLVIIRGIFTARYTGAVLLLTGPAGSGKTPFVLNRLRQALRSGNQSVRLLVPTATLAHLQPLPFHARL